VKFYLRHAYELSACVFVVNTVMGFHYGLPIVGVLSGMAVVALGYSGYRANVK